MMNKEIKSFIDALFLKKAEVNNEHTKIQRTISTLQDFCEHDFVHVDTHPHNGNKTYRGPCECKYCRKSHK